MKYIVVLGDGMADLPYEKLGGKTPLEVAFKPNIDSIAQKSICGMCKTVPDGLKPGSDVANLSVMGYSPLKYYSGRSPLEALSIGVNMADDDLAIRCNLVTLSDEQDYKDKTMVDYSAGEISTEEAAELIGAVQAALGDDIFAFYSGVSYRHCLIMHGGEKGTGYTPPHDISGKVIGDYLPKELYGDKMTELMVASYDILKDHPINIKRIAEGKNPANSIWLWGEGSKPALPNFGELRGLKGAVISAVDLLKGIGLASGMDVIEVEGATGTVHTNFAGKAQACVKAILDGYDYVYLHMEAPDECGHQGDADGKVKSIELIDEQVVGYILKELEGEDLRILICPDHPTPLSTKTHSSEPIPFVIYDSTCIKNGVSAYTENECKNTGLMLNSGDELVQLFLQEDDNMNEEMNENNFDDLFAVQSSDVEEDTQNVESELAVEDDLNSATSEQNVDQQINMQSEGDIESVAINDDNGEDAIVEENIATEENVVTSATSDDDNNVEVQNDEAQNPIEGNMIFVDDSNNANNPSNIDPNLQNGEQNGEVAPNEEGDKQSKKGKKNGGEKKKMSPKKKKILAIVISVLVLAVIITISVVTPILVINAPKIMISEAADFAVAVKDNKKLYYLKNDITVDGNLTLGLNLDLNKRTLTVNGTLILENPKGGTLNVGDQSGKEYIFGGKIIAKKLVIKGAQNVNLLTNITADDVVFEDIKTKGIATGSIQANKSFEVRNCTDFAFDSLAFGVDTDADIKEILAVNSNILLNKAAKIDINLQNSKLRAIGDTGNITLDKSSELRHLGSVYNDFESKELGTIDGGNLVYVSENGNFGVIKNANKVRISQNATGRTENCGDVKCIGQLDRPQFIDVKRVGEKASLDLSSVDSGAKWIVVTIDYGKDSETIKVEIESGKIDEYNGGYVVDLQDKLNRVGEYNIKVVLQSEDPEFVKDSEPYFIKHIHKITLDKVGDPKVIKGDDGNYTLTFKPVHFAQKYEVVFDGVAFTIDNDKYMGSDGMINWILNENAQFAEFLKTPGPHSITIVSKSDDKNILSSEKAYAQFKPIEVELAKPELKIDGTTDADKWFLSWGKVDNAVRYEIVLINENPGEGESKEYKINLSGNDLQLVLSKAEFAKYTKVQIKAIGGKYYTDSVLEIELKDNTQNNG